MDAFEILVIVLSSILAIFLVGATIAIFIFVKILKDVKNITDKASQAADNIEQAAELFKKTSGVAAITKVVSNAISMFKHNSKEK